MRTVLKGYEYLYPKTGPFHITPKMLGVTSSYSYPTYNVGEHQQHQQQHMPMPLPLPMPMPMP